MPLQSGSTRDIIANNISEMEDSGHPKKQAVAAALHTAYDPKLKRPSLHPKHPFNSPKAPDNMHPAKKALGVMKVNTPAPIVPKPAPIVPAPQTMDTRAIVKQSIVPGGKRIPIVSGGEFGK